MCSTDVSRLSFVTCFVCVFINIKDNRCSWPMINRKYFLKFQLTMQYGLTANCTRFHFTPEVPLPILYHGRSKLIIYNFCYTFTYRTYSSMVPWPCLHYIFHNTIALSSTIQPENIESLRAGATSFQPGMYPRSPFAYYGVRSEKTVIVQHKDSNSK